MISVFNNVRTILFHRNIRFMSTVVKVIPELDKDVCENIESNKMNPKKHPGIVKQKHVELPTDIQEIMLTIIGDTSKKQLIDDSAVFSRYLCARQPPTDKNIKDEKKFLFKKEILSKFNVDFENISDEERAYYKQVIKSKVDVLMKQRLYHWHSIDYTKYNSLIYLYSRAAPEYAVLNQIFKEINNKMQFSPATLFDFGSGIGTVIWAAKNIWHESLVQFFCVDISPDMNDLSREILKSRKDNALEKRVFQRQFLPASQMHQYDIVVSSYSLLELPSTSSRLETLLNLWQKTKSVLVLVEYGTVAGFKVINEAKDFILGISKDAKSNSSLAHVIAPCPHDFACPRLMIDEHCNFGVTFIEHNHKQTCARELYSYVVLMKGKREVDDPQWPRIIKPVILRSRHAICRLCTDSGSLQEIIFTPTKHGKTLYKCAKSSHWGDKLPVSLKYITKCKTIKNSMEEESIE